MAGHLFPISAGWSPLGDGTVTYDTRPIFSYTMLDKDINRRTLAESNLERDLGILVSNNLSWEDQVNAAVSKASRISGLKVPSKT